MSRQFDSSQERKGTGAINERAHAQNASMPLSTILSTMGVLLGYLVVIALGCFLLAFIAYVLAVAS